jgi:hypothetical protein
MSDHPARTEEERTAFFDELMREERDRAPVSGFAIATLVFGVLGGALALVFGIAALVQIRQRERRGLPFVVAGLVLFVAWAVAITVVVSRSSGNGNRPVSGLDLKVGECFAAPGSSGDDSVARLSCTDWHTGEVFSVIRLPAGDYPGIVEQYEDALTRCEASAENNAAVASLRTGRVQVMTMSPESWKKRKEPLAVCYFRFSNEVNHPI